jgi:hypothetical protein
MARNYRRMQDMNPGKVLRLIVMTATGIRNNAVHAADVAVNTDKTSSQNSAIKKRAQFAFHKPGNHTSAIMLPGQKGFVVFGHHMIKNALFRTARVTLKSGFANTETPGCK